MKWILTKQVHETVIDEPALKAVAERINRLKGLLSGSACLLSNWIGQCKCSASNNCFDCQKSQKLIGEIERALKGE